MEVVSSCPLRVASVVWQPREGAFMLTVVCKATYALLPTESVLADVQDDPNETDDHWNDDERRSLSAASDLVPFKRGADVLLVGHAHAPRAHPGGPLLARLIVGSTIDKTIEVHGERAWTADGQLIEERSFDKVALRWERAAGGPGTSNPVGVPFNPPPDRRRLRPVPNLQPPGMRLVSPIDPIPPVGFGPIAPRWPDRTAKLHRHAGVWDHRTWNQAPLPGDIDASYFNAAPPDQRVEQLRGDERVVLEGLHPELPQLVTSLRAVKPRALTQRSGGSGEEVQLRCDTLCIDTDRQVCSLTWRGAVPLSHPREPGRVVVTCEGAPPPRSARGGGATTLFLGLRESAHAATAPALPFVERPQGAAPPAPPPVAGPPAAAPAAYAPLPAAPPMIGPLAGLTAAEPASAPPPALPPSMIGPLAGLKAAEPASVPSTLPPPAPPPSTPALAALAAPAPSPSLEPALDPAEIPIERFAAISAEIAERRDPRAEVLRSHRLNERSWASIERHWVDAIQEESARGVHDLQSASDRAYVAAVEGFRGPITPAEYTRIVASLDRGQANAVLDELKIHRSALMPILRSWTKQVAGNARAAGEAVAALSAARGQKSG